MKKVDYEPIIAEARFWDCLECNWRNKNTYFRGMIPNCINCGKKFIWGKKK